MKNSFFKIVGGFSLVTASLALIVAVLVGLKAGNDFFASADEGITHPRIDFDSFYEKKKEVSQINTGKDVQKNKEQSKEDEKYFKKLDPLMESITKSLNDFAKVTNQGSVDPNGFEDYLIQNTEIMGREDYLVFLEELDDAVDDLNDEADTIAKMKPGDEKYIHWANDFLPWFIKSYISDYAKELQRIDNEKLQAQAEKASSIATAGVAASAFMSFVFFTLIVLLVQIERNTRK